MKIQVFFLRYCTLLLTSLFLLIPFLSFTQGTVVIQLLDDRSKEPITEATFQYGRQSGISDGEGYIQLIYNIAAELKLSHLVYGTWTLEEKDVQAAIESGQILKEKLTIHLVPVSIIAFRPKRNEVEQLELDNVDRMAHDGGAILNQMPLISSIRKSGSYGFDPVLRGFKYDQLNVVLDGLQVALAACPNRMDPSTSHIVPNMMDRVEIFKGPHALRFGSGFGGTINFVSTLSNFSAIPYKYGRFTSAYESNQHVSRNEGVVGFRGEKYDFGLFASLALGDDYMDGKMKTVQSDFYRRSFGLQGALKLSKNQELQFSTALNYAKDVDFPALPMDLRKDNTWLFSAGHQVSFEHTDLKSIHTKIYGTFVDHLMDNGLKAIDNRTVSARTDANTSTYGARSEGLWSFTSGTLYVGGDVSMEEAEGIRTREFLTGPSEGMTIIDNAWQHGRIIKSGLFAEYHLKRHGYQLIFSGRMDLNKSEIIEAADEFVNQYSDTEQTQINPSLSLGGIVHVNQNLAVGLWLARAQRSGSIAERYINYFPIGLDPYEMVGNPLLDPEVNNEVDMTFEYRTNDASIQLDLFASLIRDQISSFINTDLAPRLLSSPGVRQFENIGKARITGFEFSWTQRIFSNVHHEMAIAYTHGKDLERNAPLPEISPLDFRYRLTGQFAKDKFSPEISFRHVLAQNRFSPEFGENATPNFTLVDLLLMYKANPTLSLRTGVLNAFNVGYYEHLNRSVRSTSTQPIYAPGRNIYISVSLDVM